MARGDRDTVSASGFDCGDLFGQARADAQALKLGEHDQPRDAFCALPAEGGDDRAEGHGLVLPEGGVTGGGPAQVAGQIVMRREPRPERLRRANDRQDPETWFVDVVQRLAESAGLVSRR